MLHREVHTVEVAALDVAVPAAQRPDREHHGVVPVTQLLDRQVDADFAFGDETRSLGAHLRQPLVQHRLLELVFGNAVAHQSAEPVITLVHRDVMARAGELLCGGQSRRTGADNRDALARRDGRRLRFHAAGHPRVIGDGLFDALDRDAAAGRVVGDRQHARRFARRRAQTSGELGEVVGGVQPIAGRVPPATPHQIVPLRDQIAQRTARSSRVAERDSAVHAPPRLLGHLERPLLWILPFVDLTPVADPLVHGSLGGLDLGHFEKSVRISHGSPP